MSTTRRQKKTEAAARSIVAQCESALRALSYRGWKRQLDAEIRLYSKDALIPMSATFSHKRRQMARSMRTRRQVEFVLFWFAVGVALGALYMLTSGCQSEPSEAYRKPSSRFNLDQPRWESGR